MIAQELGAILNVRAINTAQVQYYSLFDRYASSLSELGPPSDGKAGLLQVGVAIEEIFSIRRAGKTGSSILKNVVPLSELKQSGAQKLLIEILKRLLESLGADPVVSSFTRTGVELGWFWALATMI